MRRVGCRQPGKRQRDGRGGGQTAKQRGQQQPAPLAQQLHAEVADVGDPEDQQNQDRDIAGIEVGDAPEVAIGGKRQHHGGDHQQLQRGLQLALVEESQQAVQLGLEPEHHRGGHRAGQSLDTEAGAGQQAKQEADQYRELAGVAEGVESPRRQDVAQRGEGDHPEAGNEDRSRPEGRPQRPRDATHQSDHGERPQTRIVGIGAPLFPAPLQTDDQSDAQCDAGRRQHPQGFTFHRDNLRHSHAIVP